MNSRVSLRSTRATCSIHIFIFALSAANSDVERNLEDRTL